MKRHRELVHGVPFGNPKSNPSSGKTKKNRFRVAKSIYSSPGGHHSSSKEWPFRGYSDISNAMKSMTEFSESISQNGLYTHSNVQYLQKQLNIRTAELSDIKSNYWLVHWKMIKGITGFYCKRCQSFKSDFVRNLGYDLTVEGRHRCDEIKVKNIHAVSIRKSDVEATDKFWAQLLLHHVQILMPGIKYLSSEDFSQIFDIYRNTFGYDAAKLMIGIPDRYCLYKSDESENLTWLAKALKNPGKKTELNEEEVIDFLRKVKSSYAMFEIPTFNPPKMIMLALNS